MEFVFHSPSRAEIETTGAESAELPDDARRKFEQTHSDGSELTDSWKFWRRKLKSGSSIPVFYLESAEGEVTDLGLAQMFRLGGLLALHDGLPEDHRRKTPDFCDTIFGHIKAPAALASRLSFGTAVDRDGTAQTADETLWTVLGSPKPSFYPNYLQQPSGRAKDELGGRDFSTYLSEKIRLKGWKRYAILPDIEGGSLPQVPKPPPSDDGKPNYRTATAFRPLLSGARFAGSIRFHNLRPHELGAILWAIDWGGRSDLRHSLGMAKPLGFGSVAVSLANSTSDALSDNSATEVSLDDCRDAFIARMNERGSDWENSDAMAELLALADPEAGRKLMEDKLNRYPKLTMTGRRENHFAKAKGAQRNQRLILPDYTTRIGRKDQNVWQEPPAPRGREEKSTSSQPAQPVPEEEVTIVTKRSKLRAQAADGQKLLFEGDAAEGERWMGVRVGGASNATIRLKKKIK